MGSRGVGKVTLGDVRREGEVFVAETLPNSRVH